MELEGGGDKSQFRANLIAAPKICLSPRRNKQNPPLDWSPPPKKTFSRHFAGICGNRRGGGLSLYLPPSSPLLRHIQAARVIILLLGSWPGEQGRGRLHPSPQGKIPRNMGDDLAYGKSPKFSILGTFQKKLLDLTRVSFNLKKLFGNINRQNSSIRGKKRRFHLGRGGAISHAFPLLLLILRPVPKREEEPPLTHYVLLLYHHTYPEYVRLWFPIQKGRRKEGGAVTVDGDTMK